MKEDYYYYNSTNGYAEWNNVLNESLNQSRQ